MPIPKLTSDGLLPPGEHECTLEEIYNVFGRMPNYERREYLFNELERFVKEVRYMDVATELIVDRSFTTSLETHPGDIDIFLVLKPNITRDYAEQKIGHTRGRKRWFGYGDLEVFPDHRGTDYYENIMQHFKMVDFDENLERGVLKVKL
jgi:hypothetical protein